MDIQDQIIREIQNYLEDNSIDFNSNNEAFKKQSLRDDLILDSIDIIELILVIEKAFSIVIPDDKVENVKTINDIINIAISEI